MATLQIAYGNATKTLTLISEGQYSSEYFARDNLREYRVKIRHSKEKAAKGDVALDRHNLEFTVRTFPTAELPAGSTEQAYLVFRTNPNGDGTSGLGLATGLCAYGAFVAANLVNWESVMPNT